MNPNSNVVDRDDASTESFTVRDAASANWVVRKIAEARLRAASAKAWAEAEQRRAERDEAFLLHRFGAQLEAWARSQIAAQHDGRTSVSLPAGMIGLRTQPVKLAVADEPRLLAWCAANLPTAIKIVQTVQKTPLKEHLAATGECPDGTELVGGEQRFYVTPRSLKIVEGVADAASEEQAEG